MVRLPGLPGWGRGADLPSADPMLPGPLAGAFAADQAQDAITGQAREALMEEKVSNLLEGVLTSLATAALTQLERAPQGTVRSQVLQGIHQAAVGGGYAPPPTNTEAPLPPAPPPPPTDPVGPSGGEFPEGSDTQVPDRPQTPQSILAAYREGREKGRSMTMSSAAKALAAPVGRALSEANTGWTAGTTSTGEAGWVRQENGEVVDEASFGSLAGKTLAARAAIGGSLTRIAAGDAAFAGRLGMIGARIAGPIGLGVGAVAAGGQFLEGQFEAGAPYRAAFGEDVGPFALRERATGFIQGLQGFGTIGGDRAREQYARATAMGLRGDRREAAQDFAGDMYMRFGIDTSESMQIVEQAVRQGNVSLTAFGEAITEVSRAAVEAGRSSREAIQEFVDTQALVASQITPGAASIGVTQDITALTEGLPRALQETIGGPKGLAGMLNQQNVMTVAAMSGQDPMAAWFAIQNPATARDQAADIFGGMGQQIVQIMARAMGKTEEELRAQVAELTGGERVSQEAQYEIFIQLAGGTEQAAGVMQMVLQQVVGFFGMPISQAQLLNLFFEAVQGGMGASPQAREAVGNIGGRVSRGLRGAFAGLGFGGGGGGGDGRPTYEVGSGMREDILKNMGYSLRSTGSGGYGIVGGIPGGTGPADRGAFEAYRQQVAKTGKGDPYVEALLSKEGMSQVAEASGGDAADAKFRIMVDGKARDMSLEQVISGGYTSQLSRAGVVSSANPNDNPQTVRVVMELSSDAKRWFREQTGPSDEQRRGVPPSGSRSPASIPAYGSE